MHLPVLVLIAVGLAMDAFAVALAVGANLQYVSFRQFFRLSFHFGLFQAMMPVLGWFAGQGALSYVAAWDHWVVFGLLGFIGLKAIVEALRKGEQTPASAQADPTRGLSLVALSTATSIDALAVGFSFSMLQVKVWYPSVVIGFITAALTTLGLGLGSKTRARYGRAVEVAGGVILIGIGVKVLADHLFF